MQDPAIELTVSAPGSARQVVAPDSSAVHSQIPKDWADRLVGIVREEKIQIDYAMRELGVPLRDVLAKLAKRVLERGKDDEDDDDEDVGD